jgi:CheY-like chemotaxis protein
MASTRAPSVAVDSRSEATQRTVLLVDDDQRVRETIRMMLERAGHRVVEAESAEDAINQVNTMESVDLLVSDLQMPGLSGLELFDRLVERLPSLRVLFISGAASPADLRTITRKGALLEKPFSAKMLATKVHEILS